MHACLAVGWMTTGRQLQQVSDGYAGILDSGGGANYLPIWVSLEGLFVPRYEVPL